MYDQKDPVEAVVLAWTVPGACPPFHRAAKRVVAKHMPLLARALDRLAAERGRR